MSDLVEQLRSAPNRLLNLMPNAEKLMIAAADEIERLTKEVERLRRENTMWDPD
jgi:HAMP domain-containing protein